MLKDLQKDYDKLQMKYGAKELDSIYNGGCENNPNICFKTGIMNFVTMYMMK